MININGNTKESQPTEIEDELEILFASLMHECYYNPPGARLSAKLRTKLERLSPVARLNVCSRTSDGCAPLFIASQRGNVELVEYLVHVCNAQLEQRGRFRVPADCSVHTVTPLWCAAVCGRTRVVRALADAGADLDAPSDSGSTPLRSACFMSHSDVVRLLVERGADVCLPNHNGGTCLINAVQSARLCAYLLDHGAEVNARDTQLKTVLHYAVQEHRIETVRLLLDRGADPMAVSRAGDDALRTASLRGVAPVVRMLADRVQYDVERLADGYELLGATLLEESNDVGAALAYWRLAGEMRASEPHEHGGNIEKRGWRFANDNELARAAFGEIREWGGPNELHHLAGNVDLMRQHSLLVAMRVLGPHHKDTIFRLMYRGAALADDYRLRECARLWTWALSLRLEHDTVLHGEGSLVTCALTRLLTGAWPDDTSAPHYEEIARAFRTIVRHLPEGARLLGLQPRSRHQADAFDRVLRCITHLLVPLLRTANTSDRQRDARAAITELVAEEPRTAHTGDTLLHLAVSRLNVIRSTYFAEEFAGEPPFPSVEVVRALLECGARVDALNESCSTPLHVAVIPYNFSSEIVEELLNYGAHLDRPNRFGDSAAELVLLNRGSRVCVLQHVTLRCLAARAVLLKSTSEQHSALPHSLVDTLRLHETPLTTSSPEPPAEPDPIQSSLGLS